MMIRPISDDDVRTVAELYTDNWKISYRNLLPDFFLNGLTYGHSEEKWLEYIHADEHGAFVAADENGKIIGFSAYKPDDDPEKCLLLDSLHVIRSVQGGGVGRKLIFATGKYAFENGYEKMSVSIIKGNDRAGEIYKHLGAKPFKDFIDNFEGTPADSSVFVWDDLSIFISG